MFATIKSINSRLDYTTIYIHIETIGSEKYVDYVMNDNIKFVQSPKLTLDTFLKQNNLEIVEEYERVI